MRRVAEPNATLTNADSPFLPPLPSLSLSLSLSQYNQGSAPPISKYLTLSSSTSSSLTRPGVKGAWRTNSSSAVPSLGAVGEGVGA